MKAMTRSILALMLVLSLSGCGSDNEVNTNGNLLGQNTNLNTFGNQNGVNLQILTNTQLYNINSSNDDLMLRNDNNRLTFFRYGNWESVQGSWGIQGTSVVLITLNGTRYATGSTIKYNGRDCIQLTMNRNGGFNGYDNYYGGYYGGYNGGYNYGRIETFCRR